MIKKLMVRLENKRGMKRGVLVGLTLLILLVGIVIYNIILNNSISVEAENVYIENLPEEFEGFRILQISDLHNKSFGKNQEDLIKLVNSLEYDMVAITGDMGDEAYTDDFTPFIDLLEGITDKENIFYIRGNNGPKSINEETGKITKVGRYLIEKGCNVLEKPFPIRRGESTLWVSRFLSIEDQKGFNVDIGSDDVQVVVTHYPMDESFYEGMAKDVIPAYDLILTGHYHGGQYRIPGIGAVFIPDVNGNGLFPSKERVSGLTTWGGYNQYVSAGLGASSNIRLLQFRLFNKPKIDIITLKNSK